MFSTRGKVLGHRLRECRGLHGNEAGAAIEGVEPAVAKQPRPALRRAPEARAFRDRPLHRQARVVGSVAEIGERAEVEIAGSVVFVSRERGMLAEDRGGGLEREGPAVAEAAADLRERRPVGPGLAGAREEAALA